MDVLWLSYILQVAVLIGLVVLIVTLIVANRKSKGTAAERSEGRLPRPWNTYAVGAFVAAFFLVLVPTVLAIVALIQIGRTGERGGGFAIAALGLQALQFVSLAVYLLAANEPLGAQ